jgi:hypothetical protein
MPLSNKARFTLAASCAKCKKVGAGNTALIWQKAQSRTQNTQAATFMIHSYPVEIIHDTTCPV